MKKAIDIIFLVGTVILVAGVYLQFGLGYSLIACGTIVIKFALISAYVNKDVSDTEEEG